LVEGAEQLQELAGEPGDVGGQAADLLFQFPGGLLLGTIVSLVPPDRGIGGIGGGSGDRGDGGCHYLSLTWFERMFGMLGVRSDTALAPRPSMGVAPLIAPERERASRTQRSAPVASWAAASSVPSRSTWIAASIWGLRCSSGPGSLQPAARSTSRAAPVAGPGRNGRRRSMPRAAVSNSMASTRRIPSMARASLRAAAHPIET